MNRDILDGYTNLRPIDPDLRERALNLGTKSVTLVEAANRIGFAIRETLERKEQES